MLDTADVKLLEDSFPFFEKLSPAELLNVTKSAYSLRYERGEILLDSQSHCTGLLLVKEGQLRAFIVSEEGKEITLYRLLERDVCILSASCMLKNINFTINLEVEKPAKLCVIPANVFEELSDSNPYVKEYALGLVTSRFSDVMWIMEQVVFSSMSKRIAAFLLEQAALDNTDSLAITHEAIAKNVGTAREVITRMLKYFQTEGAVSLSRGVIVITDIHKLRGFSD